MQKKTSIEWTDVTWNPVVGCRHVAEGSMVERIDPVPQLVTHVVYGVRNLHAGAGARFYRERQHQPSLLVLDLHVRQNGSAEKLRAFSEHLKTVLRLVVRVAAQVRLIMQLDGASPKASGDPVDYSPVRHGDRHDRVHRTAALRPDGGNENAPLAIDQPGQVGALFKSKRCDFVRRALRYFLRMDSRVSSAVILLLV